MYNQEHSYAPNSTAKSISVNLINQAKRSLDHEIPLYETNKERDTYQSLSELYSIIVAINILEKSFIKDKFENNEDYYTNTEMRLLNQFNLILKDDDVSQEYQDLDSFVKRLKIDCPLAVKRIKIGIPSTVENSNSVPMSNTSSSTLNLNNKNNTSSNNNNQNNTLSNLGKSTVISQGEGNFKGKAIAEATGSFITLMDAIKLDYNTKEQLHPLLSDIITSTNKLFNDYEGRSKLIQWLIKLNNLKLNEVVEEDELKEFLWDIDVAYKGFFSKLG
ncbi:hypothetical protein CANARDRAFT_26930 [[Candida] arabinofermentans NRRL YB-2248]|uniref:Vacuolar protein sorting-associated protein 28 n=1 Tax=[Candida] arabinofermentans NRRL YB-2248 TaxID=983967 RepID=A0A1E4T6Z9_9ASCO|nr:hypothetical protein CANARDRAFT_26930 [[Candida] arabinofermentans NRRL YB-2248]